MSDVFHQTGRCVDPTESDDNEEEQEQELALLGKKTSNEPPQFSNSTALRALQMIRIVALCGFFLFMGPMLIVTNSYILRVAHFPYPMLLCIMGLLASTGCAHFLVAIGYAKINPATANYVRGPRKFSRRLLPVGALFATSIATGNAAYMYLGVGIIQMLKAVTPLFVLTIFAIAGLEVPSAKVVLSVGVITCGTLVTATGAPSVTLFGVCLMLLSSCSEAGRLLCTQILLTRANFTVLEGQYYISPTAALVLTVGACFSEVPRAYTHLVASGKWPVLLAEQWHLFLFSMVLGSAINYLAFTLIQELGSVALKVMTTVRNVLLVCHSALFMGEVITKREVGGYVLTLVGFGAYSYFRTVEAVAVADAPTDAATSPAAVAAAASGGASAAAMIDRKAAAAAAAAAPNTLIELSNIRAGGGGGERKLSWPRHSGEKRGVPGSGPHSPGGSGGSETGRNAPRPLPLLAARDRTANEPAAAAAAIAATVVGTG